MQRNIEKLTTELIGLPKRASGNSQISSFPW